MSTRIGRSASERTALPVPAARGTDISRPAAGVVVLTRGSTEDIGHRRRHVGLEGKAAFRFLGRLQPAPGPPVGPAHLDERRLDLAAIPLVGAARLELA